MIQQVEFSLRPLPRGFHLRNQRGDKEPASAA